MNILTAVDRSPLDFRLGDYIRVPMACEPYDDWDRIVKLVFVKGQVTVTTDNGFEDDYPYYLSLAVNRPVACICCGKPSVAEYLLDGSYKWLCGPCLPVMKEAIQLMTPVEATPESIVCSADCAPIELDAMA